MGRKVDFVLSACYRDLKSFAKAGFSGEISPNKQVIVMDRHGKQIAKWAPVKKWIWFYGSSSAEGEHLGEGQGVAYLITHWEEFKRRGLNMAYKVERSNREVIERKLLTALAEEGTVAMLCSKQDLMDLRVVLREATEDQCASVEVHERWKNLLEGIELLLKKAF